MKRFLLLLLLLTACAPKAMKGNADLRLRDLIISPSATAESIVPLLTADVEVHRATGTVKGQTAGALALAGVKPDGETRVYRHHDVSLVVLGDGRVLLVQRSDEDLVSRAVELRPPCPSDGFPKQAVFYDHAWNADDPKARLALLEAMWAKEGRYVDPMNDVQGPAGLSQSIGQFRTVFAGARVKSTSGVAEAGEGWITFDWVIKSRIGLRTLYTGFDVAHLDADGKIELLAGFFGSRYP